MDIIPVYRVYRLSVCSTLLLLVLLASGCSDNEQLMNAILERDVQRVQSLIDRGTDVNARYDEGMTPLMIAAMSPSNTIVVQLIEAGAEVDARDNDGMTALHYAIHGEIVRLLIESGADVNARDNHRGMTPLMSAQNAESAKFLLEAGADPHAIDNEGRSVLERRTGRLDQSIRDLIKSYMEQ